jgi:hypothetical protein
VSSVAQRSYKVWARIDERKLPARVISFHIERKSGTGPSWRSLKLNASCELKPGNRTVVGTIHHPGGYTRVEATLRAE